ncbi:MAG: hypothetical protein KF716_13235 [Anaerolineae bacterium]|nr:hypothetical protein [Anaerolineae bacterium]
MTWLAGLLTFEQCQAVFARIGKRHLPASSIWRQAAQHGERLRGQVERDRQQVAPERISLPDAPHDHRQRKGVSMDGGMVHVRGEGWKEMKVGAVYDVATQPERDPITTDVMDMPHAVNLTYTAVLGEVPAFAQALWQLAVQQQVPTAYEASVTADGAAWIWNVAADLFPDSVQIVDWYHARQHLSAAAQALYPNHPDQATAWLKQHTDALFQGQLHSITAPLDHAGLADHSRYFHTHQRRMQYQEFREDGYPIGSGTVESAVKQYKARLTAAGMRWSRVGAERMLILRGAVLDGSFDALWRVA